MTLRWARSWPLVLGAAMVAFLPAPALAKEFNVDPGATADAGDSAWGNGVCYSNTAAACTLRAAIQEANAWVGADVVNVPAGHFTLTLGGVPEDGAASGDLDITENLTIKGAGANLTVIDAAGADRVFEILDGVEATVDRMTIQGGGGPVDWFESRGGGIWVGVGAALDLTRSRVVRNRALFGAAIYGTRSKRVLIQDSEVSDNLVLKDVDGFGAILLDPIDDGTFVEFKVERSTIANNRCVDTTGCGSGLMLRHCSEQLSSIDNSTISGNDGSGVYLNSCEVQVHHSTIVDNRGPGIWCATAGTNSGLISEIRNSVLADNGPDCNLVPGCFAVAGYRNLDSDNSCGLKVTLGDLPGRDPVLQPLGVVEPTHPYFAPTHHPRWTSPLIDAGTGSGALATDQESWGRPQDGNQSGSSEYDIGAIETLPCAGEADYSLGSTVFIGDSFIEGCRSVTSGAGVDIHAGTVVFVAREWIAIDNGFSVRAGAEFRAQIARWAGAGL